MQEHESHRLAMWRFNANQSWSWERRQPPAVTHTTRRRSLLLRSSDAAAGEWEEDEGRGGVLRTFSREGRLLSHEGSLMIRSKRFGRLHSDMPSSSAWPQCHHSLLHSGHFTRHSNAILPLFGGRGYLIVSKCDTSEH